MHAAAATKGQTCLAQANSIWIGASLLLRDILKESSSTSYKHRREAGHWRIHYLYIAVLLPIVIDWYRQSITQDIDWQKSIALDNSSSKILIVIDCYRFLLLNNTWHKRDVHLQHASWIIFSFGLLWDLFLPLCFLKQIIEITRALTLFFISLHYNADATMRL